MEDTTPKEEFTPIEDNLERDYVLQDLVASTNLYPENAIGITLQVHGLLVSGVIIAGDEYYRRLADELAKPGSKNHAFYVAQGDTYREDRERENGSSIPPGYIHLVEARVIRSMGPSINVSLWRGRISAVDAFSMGRLVEKDQ